MSGAEMLLLVEWYQSISSSADVIVYERIIQNLSYAESNI